MRNVNRFLETVKAHEYSDLHLPTVFRDAGPAEADEVIEAMYVIGERRSSRGDPVGIEEVTTAVRELIADQRILDAAVDVCMQGLTSSGYSESEAQRILMESTTSMIKRAGFEESRSIADLLVESVQSSARVDGELPRDFGPVHSGGRPRYELRRLIGRGSQGCVYEATDRAFAEYKSAAYVALKILHGQQEEKHTQEGSRARRIRHKNVARVIDQGVTESGEHFIAYELIEGLTLDKWVPQHEESLTAKAACKMMMLIAQGVQSAHNAGIVHRDLKPANILINREGEPVVTDFGIAYAENMSMQDVRGGTRGSLAFMAPEQFDGMVSGPMPSVDVYALGGILFWLVTGKYPNGDAVRSAVEWLEDRCDGGPGRVSDWGVDERLRAIIEKTLAIDPANRYQSVEGFAQDLDGYLERRPIPWMDRSPLVRTMLFVRRNPLVVLLFIAVLASTIVAVNVWSNARSAIKIEQARITEIKEKSALLSSLVQSWSSVLNAGDDPKLMETNLLFLHSISINEFIQDDSELLVELLLRKTEAGEAYLDQMQANSGSPLQLAMWHEVLASWYMNTDAVEAAEHLRETQRLIKYYAPLDSQWNRRVEDKLTALDGG